MQLYDLRNIQLACQLEPVLKIGPVEVQQKIIEGTIMSARLERTRTSVVAYGPLIPEALFDPRRIESRQTC